MVGTAMRTPQKDLPENQPVARFAGHPAALVRPADPRPSWLASPLQKVGPILAPDPAIPWMSRSVFNPSAVVVGGTVNLLFRAEDDTGVGQWHGTSRIGLARSRDGVTFDILPAPVLEPTEWYESLGGCEDPRVTEIDGRFHMTYTAYCYEDRTARLALAVSDDLLRWEKRGLMVPEVHQPPNAPGWSKAGAIVPRIVDGDYLMYFGDTGIYLARSSDLVHWDVEPEPVLRPRPTYWDGIMVEPGPSPWIDAAGDIHLLYNGDAPPHGYAAGEVVFSGADPRRILYRCNTPLLAVTEEWERKGQVGSVVFLEGMARFGGRVFFYYGAADNQLAAAVADAA